MLWKDLVACSPLWVVLERNGIKVTMDQQSLLWGPQILSSDLVTASETAFDALFLCGVTWKQRLLTWMNPIVTIDQRGDLRRVTWINMWNIKVKMSIARRGTPGVIYPESAASHWAIEVVSHVRVSIKLRLEKGSAKNLLKEIRKMWWRFSTTWYRHKWCFEIKTTNQRAKGQYEEDHFLVKSSLFVLSYRNLSQPNKWWRERVTGRHAM